MLLDQAAAESDQQNIIRLTVGVVVTEVRLCPVDNLLYDDREAVDVALTSAVDRTLRRTQQLRCRPQAGTREGIYLRDANSAFATVNDAGLRM
jgi:hypothetical protein